MSFQPSVEHGLFGFPVSHLYDISVELVIRKSFENFFVFRYFYEKFQADLANVYGGSRENVCGLI